MLKAINSLVTIYSLIKLTDQAPDNTRGEFGEEGGSRLVSYPMQTSLHYLS